MTIMAKKSAGIGDDAVWKATGKTWDEWVPLLDAAGGRDMTHKEIVAVVRDQYRIGPWWQQMVAVGYEQAIGKRVKHETTTGFSISRSKTIPVPIADVYAAWSDKRKRLQWLGDIEFTLRKATKNRSLRITWHNDTSVEAMFYDKGTSKCQVTVQHSLLRDKNAAIKMKIFWGVVLEKLLKMLTAAKK